MVHYSLTCTTYLPAIVCIVKLGQFGLGSLTPHVGHPNTCHQELMNCHGEKERGTSVPILCRITLQNVPHMDYKLLVLMSFEVTTVTSMDSQEPCLL